MALSPLISSHLYPVPSQVQRGHKARPVELLRTNTHNNITMPELRHEMQQEWTEAELEEIEG